MAELKGEQFLASGKAKVFERNLESREGRTLQKEVLVLMCPFSKEAFSLALLPITETWAAANPSFDLGPQAQFLWKTVKIYSSLCVDVTLENNCGTRFACFLNKQVNHIPKRALSMSNNLLGLLGVREQRKRQFPKQVQSHPNSRNRKCISVYTSVYSYS